MDDSVDGDGTVLPDEVVPEPESATRRPRRRVLALWAVLAVFGLGAGALAVTSGDDDPPKLPVALGAAGGGRSESLASPAAADMAMLAYVHYVAGDDLPLLGDDGPAYKLGGDVSEGRVRDLVDALGIDGDVTRGESGWTVDDGDGRHLEVYEGGGGSWWYTPDFVYDGGSAGGGVAGSSGSAGMTDEELKRREGAPVASEEPTTTLAIPAPPPDCPPNADCAFPQPEPITPPADLPSEDEARDIALDLFRDAGLDVDGAKVTVDGPYEAWYVTVEPRIDGRLVSGLGGNASIGSKGEVTSAGGVLNAPDRLGDYPVLDTRKAIDRLNEMGGGFGYGYGGRETLAVEDAPATDLPCVTPTTMIDPAATEEVPITKPADDPDTPVASDDVASQPAIAPCEPGPPPEPVEIVLHEAEEILVMVPAFDDSGDTYLVPGYRMSGDDGAVVEVAAVDDESLLPQPEPATGRKDGGPVTTMPADVRCATPEPGPDGAVPEICLDPNSVSPVEPAEDPAAG